MTKLLPDLLPCPFCGSNKIDNFVRTTCEDCGASTKRFHTGDTRTEKYLSREAWNTRANPPSADCVTQEMYDAGEKVLNKAFAKGHQACPEMVYKAMLDADTQKSNINCVPVYYCQNGKSLDGLEKGALAVLSNLMMKTNADKAEFMIANEKDGEFHFKAKWNKVNETDFVNIAAAPQAPDVDVEKLREAIEELEFEREIYPESMTAWDMALDTLLQIARAHLAMMEARDV